MSITIHKIYFQISQRCRYSTSRYHRHIFRSRFSCYLPIRFDQQDCCQWGRSRNPWRYTDRYLRGGHRRLSQCCDENYRQKWWRYYHFGWGRRSFGESHFNDNSWIYFRDYSFVIDSNDVYLQQALRFEIMDPNSPFEIFVRELVAMDGVDSSEITLIDSDGCPTEHFIMGPLYKAAPSGKVTNHTFIMNYIRTKTYRF